MIPVSLLIFNKIHAFRISTDCAQQQDAQFGEIIPSHQTSVILRKENTSLRGPQARGNPRNQALSTIGSPSKIEGIAPQDSLRSPRRFAPRNDVFFFRCCHRRAVGLRPPLHHSWWVPGRPQGSPLREASKIAPRREPGGFGVT